MERNVELALNWITSWTESPWRNAIATVLCFAIVLSEVELITALKRKSYLSVTVSRKLTHMLTGLIFLLAWVFFDGTPTAAYYAFSVPAAVTAKFVVIGLGLKNDVATVSMLSRTGDMTELLRGPASYGVVISLATILWWRSLTALVTIVVLCAGDGASGLFGPIYGKNKLSWNKAKTWEGSFFFVLFSSVATLLMHQYFVYAGWLASPFFDSISAAIYISKVLLVCAGAAFVESLPIRDWDNVTVFLASLSLSKIL